jgi:hypothetical protein
VTSPHIGTYGDDALGGDVANELTFEKKTKEMTTS